MAPRRTSTSLVPGPFPSGPGMALATATPRPAPPATPTGATSHDHFGTCTPCHPTCHPACCAPRQPATHRAAGSARGRPATGPGTFALFRPAHCPASTAAAGGALSSAPARDRAANADGPDRKSTRLNSSHLVISYAVFCLKKKICSHPAISLILSAYALTESLVQSPAPAHLIATMDPKILAETAGAVNDNGTRARTLAEVL